MNEYIDRAAFGKWLDTAQTQFCDHCTDFECMACFEAWVAEWIPADVVSREEYEAERYRHDRLQDWDTALTAKYEEALAEIERLQSQLDLWRD